MTRVDILERFWRHFVVEGNEPAVNASGVGCVYVVQNAERRLGCAVGILLSDPLRAALMASGLNGASVTSVLYCPPQDRGEFGREINEWMRAELMHDLYLESEEQRIGFLDRLQKQHDEYEVFKSIPEQGKDLWFTRMLTSGVS